MRRPAIALGAVLLAAVAGCGVPSDPTPIAISRVPYDLLSPAGTATPRPTAPAVRGPFVYLLDGEDRLVPVETQVVDEVPVAAIGSVLARLSEGPTEDERRAGLSTALGPSATLTLRSLEDGQAVIEVDSGSPEPSAGRLPLAVGQVVLSVTSVSGVDSVVLTDSGQPVAAPLPDGARTDRPLTRADFEVLVGSSSPPSTTTP